MQSLPSTSSQAAFPTDTSSPSMLHSPEVADLPFKNAITSHFPTFNFEKLSFAPRQPLLSEQKCCCCTLLTGAKATNHSFPTFTQQTPPSIIYTVQDHRKFHRIKKLSLVIYIYYYTSFRAIPVTSVIRAILP